MTATHSHRISRRTLTSSAAGFAVGSAFAGLGSGRVAAQGATPVADLVPLGFISVRLREVATEDARSQVNERVVDEFMPVVEALEGFRGYTLGDIVEAPEISLAIVVLEDESQSGTFDEAAMTFVSGLGADLSPVATTAYVGDVLIAAAPVPAASGTPSATPVTAASPVEPYTDGYITMRIRTGTPGTDAQDVAPRVAAGFLPLVQGIAGFRGYLWFPIENGRVTLSFFDSAETAAEVNAIGLAWADENLAEFTEGEPEAYDAMVVYQNMPILD